MWHTFTNCLPEALVGSQGLGNNVSILLAAEIRIGPKTAKNNKSFHDSSTIPPRTFCSSLCKLIVKIWACVRQMQMDVLHMSAKWPLCPEPCLSQLLPHATTVTTLRKVFSSPCTHEYTNTRIYKYTNTQIYIYKNTSPTSCLPCHWLVIQAAGTLV